MKEKHLGLMSLALLCLALMLTTGSVLWLVWQPVAPTFKALEKMNTRVRPVPNVDTVARNTMRRLLPELEHLRVPESPVAGTVNLEMLGYTEPSHD
ncbi:MAG: hypothetical protein H7839_09250 [Magnetococcus sp. YQC-5]